MIVGGYAVNFHGYSRNTVDIDLIINIGEINIVQAPSAEPLDLGLKELDVEAPQTDQSFFTSNKTPILAGGLVVLVFAAFAKKFLSYDNEKYQRQ